MRIGYMVAVMALLPAASCLAQSHNVEFGGLAGLGISPSLTVNSPAGTASAKLKPGVAVGAFVTHNMYDHLSGELRYMYRRTTMQLSAGGTEWTFPGATHSLHYDFLVFANKRAAAVRPYLAIGGGARRFSGTGREVEIQPLNSYAILTKTYEYRMMGVVGGGIMARVSDKVHLRLDVLDYITKTPQQVIAPVRGAKINEWLHDLTPTVGLSFTF